jgi:hypothetical protein
MLTWFYRDALAVELSDLIDILTICLMDELLVDAGDLVDETLEPAVYLYFH